jgi:hypothetical protein
VGRHRDLALTLDCSHLRRMVVVVRERPIDIGDVEVVTVGDCAGCEPAVLNLRLDELDGDSSPSRCGSPWSSRTIWRDT